MFKKSKKGYYYWEEFSKNNGLVHGISTRFFGSIKDKGRINEGDLKKFLDVLNIDRKNVVFPEQVHGSNVIIIDDSKKKFILNADGLITAKKNFFLGVVTADCLPVIFYDETMGIVGISHAGYKGLLSGILQEMLKAMKKMGVDVKNIKIAIGPAIGVCCYDVSIERVELFKNAFKSIKTHEKRNGKYFLDLKNIAKQRLILEGVPENNIEVSDICTKDNIKDFFSFRGEGKEKFGEFATIIGLRNTTSEESIRTPTPVKSRRTR